MMVADVAYGESSSNLRSSKDVRRSDESKLSQTRIDIPLLLLKSHDAAPKRRQQLKETRTVDGTSRSKRYLALPFDVATPSGVPERPRLCLGRRFDDKL